MRPLICYLIFVLQVTLVGCQDSEPAPPRPSASGNKIAAKLAAGSGSTEPQAGRPRNAEAGAVKETESEFDFSFRGADSFDKVGAAGFSGSSPARHETRAGLSTAQIVQRIAALLKDSIDYGPTLAVWIIDESASARPLTSDLANTLRQPYVALRREGDRFVTAVCTVGQQVRFPVDAPAPDPAALPDVLDGLTTDPSGKEMLFTALRESLTKYLRYRTDERREVIFLMVTDEAGNDQELCDELAEQFRRHELPLYVIGVPAPLGRSAALAASVEVAGDPQAIRQGPESRQPESVQLGFWGGMNDLKFLDSGFGPFALERLCRASGGRYIAVRPATSGFSFAGAIQTEWPSPGVWQPDANVMQKYAPDYVSAADYQALLQGNAACRALHDAAQLPTVEFAQLPQTSFAKRSEADLANDVTRAQQFAAKLEDGVNRVYEVLEQGARDRDKLPSARWRASYDLALGRAAAAKARVDGYNAMLAELKRGKTFSNSASTIWELATAETTEASSGLKKLGETAQTYLQRVIAEHPGTPWAKLAEHELQTPIGWKWTER